MPNFTLTSNFSWLRVGCSSLKGRWRYLSQWFRYLFCQIFQRLPNGWVPLRKGWRRLGWRRWVDFSALYHVSFVTLTLDLFCRMLEAMLTQTHPRKELFVDFISLWLTGKFGGCRWFWPHKLLDWVSILISVRYILPSQVFHKIIKIESTDIASFFHSFSSNSQLVTSPKPPCSANSALVTLISLSPTPHNSSHRNPRLWTHDYSPLDRSTMGLCDHSCIMRRSTCW